MLCGDTRLKSRALVGCPVSLRQAVELLLFDQPRHSSPVQRLRMQRGSHGQWTAQGPASDWVGLYYQYELVVYHPQTQHVERSVATDPYSRGFVPFPLAPPSSAPPPGSARFGVEGLEV